jgi:uncharacterized protein (DUF302 family)
MLFEVSSRKTLAEIDTALKSAAERHKFGVLNVIDLKQTMKNKGIELGPDCVIYEVCNPLQAKKVLETNGSVSTALPCRISVHGSPGAYRIATISPTVMMRMFQGAEQLEEPARDVESHVFAIINESA